MASGNTAAVQVLDSVSEGHESRHSLDATFAGISIFQASRSVFATAFVASTAIPFCRQGNGKRGHEAEQGFHIGDDVDDAVWGSEKHLNKRSLPMAPGLIQNR